jgi:hypothetical protein
VQEIEQFFSELGSHCPPSSSEHGRRLLIYSGQVFALVHITCHASTLVVLMARHALPTIFADREPAASEATAPVAPFIYSRPCRDRTTKSREHRARSAVLSLAG